MITMTTISSTREKPLERARRPLMNSQHRDRGKMVELLLFTVALGFSEDDDEHEREDVGEA